MLAIYKREVKSYFTSMIGFIYMAIFMAIVGIYFVVYNMVYTVADFSYVLENLQFLFIIIIPILTMRLLSEERNKKTDQLLFTSPVSITQVVLGKYLAALTLYACTVILMLFYPLILTSFGTMKLAVAYSAIFGFAMQGAAFIAIGLFISAITENQVIALIVTAVTILVTNLMPSLASMIPSDHLTALLVLTLIVLIVALLLYLAMHNLTVSIAFTLVTEGCLLAVYFVKSSLYDGIVSKICNSLAMGSRFDNFSIGILDLNSIVYYLSVVVLFVVFTVQSINKRRWN
ncbi:ABC-type transport system [Lachnospiraceae bacterium KM106-2]|nr:ABC-type transport system [Lachnospiraceae bacterium KM106-2]